MAKTSAETLEAGQLTDAQGRRQVTLVAPNTPRAVTDVLAAGRLFDGDGREILAAVGAVGGNGTAVVEATGTATDLASIQAAVDAMRDTSGKLDGRLEIRGRALLTGTLELDGGYVDTTPADANWASSTPEAFELTGNFTVAAGVGMGISAHGFFNANLDVGLHDGGSRGEVTDAVATVSSAVVTSPAAISQGIAAGCVVFIDGAGQVAGGVNQPQAATVTSVDAGAGTITLQTTCAASVSAARMRWASVGLHVEDQVGLRLNVDAKSFAGCALHADATNITTKRMRSCQFGRLNFNNCGIGLFWRSVEAFGTLGDVWSDGVWSDYIGRCDDTAWTKYEGGIGGAGGVNVAESYLWLDRCNNCNIGDITVGDRATEALLKITGPCDLGVVQKIRATGFQSAHPGAGVKVLDVQSCEIQSLVTKETDVGLHIIGGRDETAGSTSYNEVVVGHHQSLTGDGVALKLEPSPISTAPLVRIGADYRNTGGEAARIETGFTGGRLRLSGLVDQPNTDGTTGPAPYGIDCQSAGMVLDVTGLWQRARSATYLAGGINHVNPDNLRGVAQARIENATVHGSSPGVWPAPGQTAFVSGTAQQNLSPRTLVLVVLTRYQPTAVGVASNTVKIGPTSAGITDAWADSIPYDSTAGNPNDESIRIMLRVPPWWWVSFTLLRASLNRVIYWYE